MDVTSYMAGSFVAHLAALAALSTTLPPMHTSEDVIEDHQRVDMYQVHIPNEQTGFPLDGTASCGDCWAMGDLDADRADRRYGVAGPQDNPDPHISRNGPGPAMWVMSWWGPPISYSSGSAAPAAPWGRDDALGTDPIDGRGAMWGEVIGVNGGDDGLGGRVPDEGQGVSAYGYRCRMP